MYHRVVRYQQHNSAFESNGPRMPKYAISERVVCHDTGPKGDHKHHFCTIIEVGWDEEHNENKYLVRWRGYSSRYDEWFHESHPSLAKLTEETQMLVPSTRKRRTPALRRPSSAKPVKKEVAGCEQVLGKRKSTASKDTVDDNNNVVVSEMKCEIGGIEEESGESGTRKSARKLVHQKQSEALTTVESSVPPVKKRPQLSAKKALPVTPKKSAEEMASTAKTAIWELQRMHCLRRRSAVSATIGGSQSGEFEPMTGAEATTDSTVSASSSTTGGNESMPALNAESDTELPVEEVLDEDDDDDIALIHEVTNSNTRRKQRIRAGNSANEAEARNVTGKHDDEEEVQITLPDFIRQTLITDHTRVNGHPPVLHDLPVRRTVSSIVDSYVESKVFDERLTLDQRTNHIHTAHDVRHHFNRAFSDLLLYQPERSQYDAYVKRLKIPSTADFVPSDHYGAIHLCRLFTFPDSLLTALARPDTGKSHIAMVLNDLLVFLVRRMQKTM